MPVKIRLQRHGKKGKPFYWVVAADARAKRDGKYLEKLGTYNPNVNPAIIDLDVDGTVKWLKNGAQPTDTARAILSYKGVMLKYHLDGGVRKGALTEAQAAEKFQVWVDAKEGKITAKEDGLAKNVEEGRAKAFAAEQKVNEDRKAAADAVKNEAIKVAADAKAAVEAAAAKTEEAAEAPESIDDAQNAAE